MKKRLSRTNKINGISGSSNKKVEIICPETTCRSLICPKEQSVYRPSSCFLTRLEHKHGNVNQSRIYSKKTHKNWQRKSQFQVRSFMEKTFVKMLLRRRNIVFIFVSLALIRVLDRFLNFFLQHLGTINDIN